MNDPVTHYPGVGADDLMNELKQLVGDVTGNWAQVEDGLFEVFVVATAGTFLLPDIRPFRAVFFTFGSYEQKMRMTHSAMTTRYATDQPLLDRWKVLRTALNGFSTVRNNIAHLVATAKSTTDPNAPANVRLVPPFWKQAFSDKEFDKLGYSLDELWQALAPYWGYHPRISLNPRAGDEGYQLSYRLQQFARELSSPPASAG